MLNWQQKSIFSLKFLRKAIAILIFISCSLVSFPVLADDTAIGIETYLENFSDRITEFKLHNGMKFIVLENHDAPVVSFVTYADVGGVDEPDGQTGVAHFLEHQLQIVMLKKIQIISEDLHSIVRHLAQRGMSRMSFQGQERMVIKNID